MQSALKGRGGFTKPINHRLRCSLHVTGGLLNKFQVEYIKNKI